MEINGHVAWPPERLCLEALSPGMVAGEVLGRDIAQER